LCNRRPACSTRRRWQHPLDLVQVASNVVLLIGTVDIDAPSFANCAIGTTEDAVFRPPSAVPDDGRMR
jgi:hypothetical protein